MNKYEIALVHALYVFEGEILHTPESKPEYPDYLWDKSKR